jgi:hypothetical protein
MTTNNPHETPPATVDEVIDRFLHDPTKKLIPTTTADKMIAGGRYKGTMFGPTELVDRVFTVLEAPADFNADPSYEYDPADVTLLKAPIEVDGERIEMVFAHGDTLEVMFDHRDLTWVDLWYNVTTEVDDDGTRTVPIADLPDGWYYVHASNSQNAMFVGPYGNRGEVERCHAEPDAEDPNRDKVVEVLHGRVARVHAYA